MCLSSIIFWFYTTHGCYDFVGVAFGNSDLPYTIDNPAVQEIVIGHNIQTGPFNITLEGSLSCQHENLLIYVPHEQYNRWQHLPIKGTHCKFSHKQEQGGGKMLCQFGCTCVGVSNCERLHLYLAAQPLYNGQSANITQVNFIQWYCKDP